MGSEVLWPLVCDACRLLCYLIPSCQPLCFLPCTQMTADINLRHTHTHTHTHTPHYSSIVVAEPLMELPVWVQIGTHTLTVSQVHTYTHADWQLVPRPLLPRMIDGNVPWRMHEAGRQWFRNGEQHSLGTETLHWIVEEENRTYRRSGMLHGCQSLRQTDTGGEKDRGRDRVFNYFKSTGRDNSSSQ